MRDRILLVVASAFVLIAALALSPTHHPQGFKKFSTAVAYVQEGAPVQLESVTFGLEFLFNKAELKNVSDRTVRSVTFGVLLRETAPYGSEPILASRREIQTDIKPGAVRTLDVLDLPLKEAQQKAMQFKSNPVLAEFGILGVQFEDGGSWSFDPQKNKTFSPSKISSSTGHSSEVNCKPQSSGLVALLGKVGSSLPTLTKVFAQSYYYSCNGSAQSEVCTNNVTSCTNRICTHAEQINHTCPNQHCQLNF